MKLQINTVVHLHNSNLRSFFVFVRFVQEVLYWEVRFYSSILTTDYAPLRFSVFGGMNGLGHNMAQSVKLDSAWAILVSLPQAAGHWEAAVHVLCDATMSRLVPNIILRSAAISACEKAVFVG